MPITIGQGLQAIGIILEGVGLYLAFKAIGTLGDQVLKNWRRVAFPGAPLDYESEIKEQKKSLYWIAAGLFLQIIGLFVQ